MAITEIFNEFPSERSSRSGLQYSDNFYDETNFMIR